jgi:hypothetical protein
MQQRARTMLLLTRSTPPAIQLTWRRCRGEPAALQAVAPTATAAARSDHGHLLMNWQRCSRCVLCPCCSWFTNLAVAANSVGIPLCASVALIDAATGTLLEQRDFPTGVQ